MQALHGAMEKENAVRSKPEVLYVRLTRELKERLMRLAIYYDRRGSLNNYLNARLEELAATDEGHMEKENKKREGVKPSPQV